MTTKRKLRKNSPIQAENVRGGSTVNGIRIERWLKMSKKEQDKIREKNG